MTPNGGEEYECGDEPTTHDDGDLWADRAPRGWERCQKCGAEWAADDEPSCTCEEEE